LPISCGIKQTGALHQVNRQTIHRVIETGTNIIRNYGVFIAAVMLVSFGLFFLINGRAEISDAIGLIASINPAWILALALLQVVTLLIAGWTYQVVLRRQGYDVGLLRLIEIHLQRVVIGVVTPVGGPASIYVLVRALRTHGVKDSDSLIVASIRTMGGVIAFLIFLIPALLLQPPTTLVMIATAGLVVVLTLALWGCVIVLRTGDAPDIVHRWAPGPILRFIETAKTHRMTATDFVMPTILQALSHVTSVVMLWVGLHALGYTAAISTVVIGYVVGKLFFMMAPVFQGIGIVEIGMVIALQQAGIPAAVAVGGALLYRVGDLWLPLLWGFIVQLIRMPLRQYLAETGRQFRALLSGGARALHLPSLEIGPRTVQLGRLALVTEAPLAVTAGVVLVIATGLPLNL
jgi:uncharacterized membrane protein YbhN (UPF0104 family)